MLTSSILPQQANLSTVCTAVTVCTHNGVEQKHDKEHVLCEHCTVESVECGGCELILVGLVDKDSLLQLGWVRTDGKWGREWMCPVCSVRDVKDER